MTECTAHGRVANAVLVGQNHFFVINFDFRNGAGVNKKPKNSKLSGMEFGEF